MRIKNQSIRLTFALLLATGLLAGCAEGKEHAEGEHKPFPVKVPAFNGDVTINALPSRVVSLSPSATEMLFKVGAGAQTVAVDGESTFPAEAPRTALSATAPDVEAIKGYKPDLVVVSQDANNLVTGLAAANIPVLIEPPAANINDVYDQMIDLGEATGNKERAIEISDEMRAEMRNLTAEIETLEDPVTYYHENDPSYKSITSASFVGSIYAQFKLKNIADTPPSSNEFPQLSAEKVASANPDIIYLADTKCCVQDINTISQRPGWSDISAVKSKSVIPIDDELTSRWGPRVIELAEQIAEGLHKYEENHRFDGKNHK